MSIRRASSYGFIVFLTVALIWGLAGSKLSSQAAPQTGTVISGRNVNMVSGTMLPGGDPWLQRQNEPSIAVSSRNPLHLLAGANDYRTVDMPTSEGEIPGKQPAAAVGDAWLGVYTSYDGGESWTSTMLPGFPQDSGNNPLKSFRAAADPVVRSGPNGLFYFSGIAFNRDTNVGVVFVARFIDDNNKENGGTIRYIDTKIIAVGTASKFLDKPWISVDQPRIPFTNITISGQSFPRHNVYIAYSSFTGTTTLLGDIMFARSADCGTSWGSPIKISSGSYAHQGATIAIKPVIGEVLVAWRRFGVSGKTPDSIFVAQSFTRGVAFQSPVKVADIAPFDQPTTTALQSLPGTGPGLAFRTNSYPTMAVDKSGHVYLAWSQRGLGPNGDSRIVLSASYLGTNWTVPQPVANYDENNSTFLGHQILPSMVFAGGKLALVWVDQRRDVSAVQYGFNKWIIDSLPYRHTMDVWAAEADTSAFPNLVWKSSQVSRYLYSVLKDNSGDIVYKNGVPVIFPVQFNCVNYPLFKGGQNPFNGDYIDIAASPSFRQDTWRNWIFNTDDTRDPVFHVVWADNRDVRPPQNGNWTVYTPPTSTQDPKYVSSSTNHPACNPNGSGNEPGMRNQNIYTSRLTWGIDAGAPVNDKPLNLVPGVARAFVVYVKNNTGSFRSFRLSIASQPAGGQASFEQFSLTTSLDVDIAAYSTISRTVFISSSDINAAVTVNVNETDAAGTIIADGLTSFIPINSDTSNPQMSGTDETHNPNIVNSANPNIVNWVFVNPNIVNPNIVNTILNPNIVNPNIVNPNIVNSANPNIVNPNIVNPNIVNPNIVNQDVGNPNIVNPNIVNPNIVNPNIVNANPDDVTATDVEWTVKNEGSTTTSYTLKTLAKKSPPQGVYVQLLVYRVHYTPAVAGAELKQAGVEACTLKQEPHHELVLNVVNPNIVNPNIVNPNIVNPNIVNADIENATFAVAPGEEVVVDLRVLDSGVSESSSLQSKPQMAMGTMAAGTSTQATTVGEFIDSLGFAVTSQAVDSADVVLGSRIPKADATDLVIGTSSLPDGVVNYSYNATLSAYGGLGGYVWSLNAGELPPGLALTSGGLITGRPTTAGTYQFIVRVDSGGQFDTQQYAIYIDSNSTPDPLNITTISIPSGVKGVWYGATLQAVGGVWPRSWSVSAGALPEGVSLDSGGIISGTPTAAGSFGFTARVADRNGTIKTKALTLVVAAEASTYFDITGFVFDEIGAPLGGVVLRGLPNTPVTAANGFYIDKVPAGWSGTAIPFVAGHPSFTPANRSYTNVSSPQSSQNYNVPATPLSVSGTVTLGGTGVAGVVMNGLPGSPVTDTSGTFLVTVNYGWTGTVTPTSSIYSFTPASRSFSNIGSNQTANFTAATLVGPAAKLVFTQQPSGGIGGAVWTGQPMVEIQDASGNRVTSDGTTRVTLNIYDDPGKGLLSGTTTMKAIAGEVSFADLSIDRGGIGYTLRATSNPSLTEAISAPFGIEGFSDTLNSMHEPRSSHSATPIVLRTGETPEDVILIAGGYSGELSTSSYEFYIPSTNSFVSYQDNMQQARSGHTATPLLDGRVLIAGGPYPDASSSAEVFNPATRQCTSVATMHSPRSDHRATLLQDGRVLITGSSVTDQLAAELYDPIRKTFTETGSMNAARFLHTSTLLPSGKVLITGGRDNVNDGAPLSSAELYDPATGEFTGIGEGMFDTRYNHQATLLDNGKVLITGGNDFYDPDFGTYYSSAEIYDPSSNTFTSIGNMMYVHEGHQVALLRDGTVLIVGGNDSSAANEIFDPNTSKFRTTGPMSSERINGAAAVLTDGRILMTGGFYFGGEGTNSSAEVWNPRVPFPTHVISGTIRYGEGGVGGVMLVGLPGHPMTNAGGYYEGLVLDGWTGTVTPAKSGFTFDPAARIYDSENPVIGDTPDQYYMVTSAPAFQLAFSQQPSPTVVGTDITPAVTVEIRDEFGNVLGNAINSVTLSLGTNPGGATLSGTLTVNAVEGVAVFSNLKIDKVGNGYTLKATSGSLTEADSSPFDITGAVPSKIQVETAADGSGTVVPAQNVRSGFSITAYAISRDAGGNFIANVAAESWSLINKTGGVIDGDLVASEDMKSATFTGNAIGSTVIHAVKTDCTSVDSGVLAVVAAEAWVARYNGPGSGDDGADGIAVDASGNVYVAGFIQVNEIDYDYATIKYDSTGHQLWVARYDGPGNSDDDAMGIAVDSSGNVYVTGMSYGNTTDYDYATIKYDSSGNQLWVVRYDGPGHGRDLGMWIAVDPSGNVYVTGESSNGIDGDYATIKYDGNGNQLWVARYDGPGHSTDRAVGIAVDTSGNVYVTGSSVGSGTNSDYATIKYANNGSQLWVARYDGPGSGIDSARRVAVDPSEDVYIAGCSAGSGTGYDFATIKYDSNGNRLWVARYNGPANGDDGFNCVSMAFDPAGNIYVLGGSAGSGPGLDYATVKYDSNGNQLWVARYNGPGNGDDEPDRVAVDPLGNAYVAGESTGSGTGYDYATIKYDSNGNQLWVARYNGPGNDSDCGYYNALDSLGNVLVSGSSIGNGTNYDFATIKYAQSFPSTLIITTSALDNGFVDTPYGKDLWAFGGSGTRTWSIVDGSGSLPPGMSLSPSIGIISGTPTTPGTYNFTVQVVDGSLNASKVLSITIQSEVYAFVTKWGSSGSGDGQFSYPYGLAVDSLGNVYVADRDNYRIQKFTSSGVFITKWGSNGSGNGQFNRPYGIAVDSAGNVYVADTENDRIQEFTSSGVFITKWGSFGSGDGQFDGPFGVAIDRLGNVYVAERDNNRIQKFTSSGVFLTKWGSSGSGDGQFIAATGIAIDSSGNVCVADCYNYRIQKFTSSGVFLTKWGSSGSGDGQFYYPSGIAVDSSGSIYVADCNNNRIQKFTSDGVFITKWGSPGSGDGQFQLATGIAVDSSGNVYVADYVNCRIQEFRQK